MARRLALILLALASSACGGTTPTTPTTSGLPPAYVLSPGAFTLTIFPAPPDMSGGTPTVCMSSNGGAGTSIAIPVTVEREGPGWSARPSSGTLRLTLAEVGPAAYYGPMAGAFTQGATTVTVGSDGDPAIAMAFTLGAASLSGRLEGVVRYTGAGGFAQSSCSSNAWSLVRR